MHASDLMDELSFEQFTPIFSIMHFLRLIFNSIQYSYIPTYFACVSYQIIAEINLNNILFSNILDSRPDPHAD